MAKEPGPQFDNPYLRVFLGAGLVYAALLFLVCGFRLTARPPTAGAYVVLAFLALFVGLAHGAFFALAAALAEKVLPARRSTRGGDALIAIGIGLFYSWLALSLAKLAMAGSHLRYEDLWFVAGSVRQLGGEGSPRERLLLLAAVLLPVLLAGALFLALRRTRGRSTAARPATSVACPPLAPVASLAPLTALLAIVLGAIVLLSWRYPYAHLATTTLVPETSWIARSRVAGEAPHAFVPDPARQARIGTWAPPERIRRDNVVVLMLESVPWSRLFGPLARPEATPRMNALAAESIVFSRAYATSTHSDYAQTSILAALHPRKFERHDYFIDLAYPRTLIWDLLRPAGYRTALFSCQNEGWGNMQAFLRTPGLELFRHSPDWPDAPRRGEGAESKVFEPTPVAAFGDWLNEAPARPVPRLSQLPGDPLSVRRPARQRRRSTSRRRSTFRPPSSPTRPTRSR